MIKQYKKLILSLGLFMGVTGAAASSSGSEEGTFDIVKLFTEGPQVNYAGLDFAETAKLIGLFCRCPDYVYMGHAKDFFPEGSIEKWSGAISELIPSNSQTGHKPIARSVLLKGIPAWTASSLEDRGRIYPVRAPEWTYLGTNDIRELSIVEENGQHFILANDGAQLIITINARIVEGTREELINMVQRMNPGDRLTILSTRPFFTADFRSPEVRKVLSKAVREKLELPKEITDEVLSRMLSISTIVLYPETSVQSEKDMQLLRRVADDPFIGRVIIEELEIFRIRTIARPFSVYIRTPELDTLRQSLPENHWLLDLIGRNSPNQHLPNS